MIGVPVLPRLEVRYHCHSVPMSPSSSSSVAVNDVPTWGCTARSVTVPFSSKFWMLMVTVLVAVSPSASAFTVMV